jgi:hypothetical protein
MNKFAKLDTHIGSGPLKSMFKIIILGRKSFYGEFELN